MQFEEFARSFLTLRLVVIDKHVVDPDIIAKAGKLMRSRVEHFSRVHARNRDGDLVNHPQVRGFLDIRLSLASSPSMPATALAVPSPSARATIT